MASLIIEVPDELASSLEGIAAAQHRTVQDLASPERFGCR